MRLFPLSTGTFTITRTASVAFAVAATMALTACGDAQESSSSSTPVVTSTAGTGDGVVEPGTGASTDTAPVAATDVITAPPTTANPDKPKVSIPATSPTKLVITDLTVGTGAAAREGDTVVVNYVGVRSADGTEFDNSYDRGQPFSVTIGKGEVIKGWDQGLVGVKQGSRRQLDIPADLAYGDNPPSDPIKAGDALTFVVDVVAVLPATDPKDAPVISVPGGPNVSELAIKDLVVGKGAELKKGQTAAVHLIAFRADTGEQLASSWESGQLQPITFEDGGSLPGLITGLDGMKLGGRRQLTIPFQLAFGAAGNSQFGLPANTDVVLVVDLITAY
jgi:peptidylprolyl isomerase